MNKEKINRKTQNYGACGKKFLKISCDLL